MNGRTLRFINFLIDSAVFFSLLVFLLYIFKNVIAQENVKWISAVFYFLYYFLFEFFIGTTVGKIITRSRVASVTKNKNYYFIKIMARTLIRFLPLDLLSYLFTYRGLHDLISYMTVIKIKEQ